MASITSGHPCDDRPLAGVRVIDWVSGPLSAIAQRYAELGADVIRIEPEQGGPDRFSGRSVAGISIDFVAVNLGKRTAAPDQFDALARDADILIARRGNVDAAALQARNPALVILLMSDFGETGPYADWRASDGVLQALSGGLSRSGLPGRVPVLPPEGLAIACAAAQAAYIALVAYWNALRTDRGDILDFSALDGVAQVLDPGFGVAGSAAVGPAGGPQDRDRPDVGFRYPIFRCRDGFVRMCVLAPKPWRALFEWLGRPEAFSDPAFDRLETRFASAELSQAIARLFAPKTRAEIEAEGERFGVPVAALLDTAEAIETEQVREREAFVPVEIAPGVSIPFPNGVLEVDGRRMGIAGPPSPLPATSAGWTDRPRPLDAEQRALRQGDERPFSALRVLDLGVIVVGAETGRLFSDQGADNIKIESSAFPDGSRLSLGGKLLTPSVAAGHRNKRSIGIDMRHPQGREVLLDLVRRVDVLLSNYKGGSLAALGLDYASLQEVNPRLVVIDSSAYGPAGPWSRRMGYGPLVRASTGLTMAWRYPDDTTGFCDASTVYPDHAASRIGAIGVIALLIRRLRTGRGGQVSVSQAEVILDQMATHIATHVLDGSGQAVMPATDMTTVHRCAGDDEWCVVTIGSAAEEAAAARVSGGRPLAEWLRGQTPHEASRSLQAEGVAAGAMLRVSDLPDFDYYVRRDFFREIEHPVMDEPFRIETRAAASRHMPDPENRPAPLPAENTRAVLRELLGFTDARLADLLNAGALEEFDAELLKTGTAA